MANSHPPFGPCLTARSGGGFLFSDPERVPTFDKAVAELLLQRGDIPAPITRDMEFSLVTIITPPKEKDLPSLLIWRNFL